MTPTHQPPDPSNHHPAYPLPNGTKMLAPPSHEDQRTLHGIEVIHIKPIKENEDLEAEKDTLQEPRCWVCKEKDKCNQNDGVRRSSLQLLW